MPFRSIEARLLAVLAVIALVAVLGVLAILPYRLYERDIRHATVEAHRISNLVHVALEHAVLEGEDPTRLISRLQGLADLQIRLRQLPPGEAHPVAAGGRGSSTLNDTQLTYVSAPIRDADGRTWLAEMEFDLAPMKRESVRLIIDLVLAVVIGAAIFSAVVFVMVRRALILPLGAVTAVIEQLHRDPSTPPRLPKFETREMAELAQAVERVCAAHRQG